MLKQNLNKSCTVISLCDTAEGKLGELAVDDEDEMEMKKVMGDLGQYTFEEYLLEFPKGLSELLIIFIFQLKCFLYIKG